jgi:phage protein D
MPRGEARTATGQTLKAMTLNKAHIKAYRLTINERGRFRQVNARWYDYKTGQEREINVGVESPAYPLRRLFVDEASARLGAQAKLKAFQTGQRELNLELIGSPDGSSPQFLGPTQ